MKKSLVFFAVLMLAVLFYAGHSYGCSAPNPVLKNTSITRLDQCMARDYQIYSRGESVNRTVNLEKGKSYRVSVQGCEYTRTVGVSLSSGAKVLKSDTGKPAGFCVIAPETGAYDLKVTMEQLISGAGNGRIDYCFYEANSCN